MSQDHCRMHQVVSSMSQAATTGAAGAGATVATAGGATVGGTAGGLGAGLSTVLTPLRKGAGLGLGLGLYRRSRRSRPAS